jgi:excisionase family DNA binding protein
VKTQLEPEDIQAIARAVMESLKPMLSGNGKHEDETIFDVQGLKDYLKVSRQWIYERTHLKEIPHMKIDGQLRFRKKEIDKWANFFSVPAITTPIRALRCIRGGGR